MLKLGTKIYNAFVKSRPVLVDGTQRIMSNQKFSLKNPYILEAIPEEYIGTLDMLEGKKLRTVVNILDNPDCNQILARYKNFCTSKAGFNDIEFHELYKKAFRGQKVSSNINIDAMVFLNQLDPKVAKNFDAHGLAKISVPDQLRQLNNLLTKGIDKNRNFYTAPLATDFPQGAGACLGTPGGHAYRDGSFILVSGKSKSLIDDGIESVIVNDAYYGIIDDLRKKFPKIKFVEAQNAAEYFNKL